MYHRLRTAYTRPEKSKISSYDCGISCLFSYIIVPGKKRHPSGLILFSLYYNPHPNSQDIVSASVFNLTPSSVYIRLATFSWKDPFRRTVVCLCVAARILLDHRKQRFVIHRLSVYFPFLGKIALLVSIPLFSQATGSVRVSAFVEPREPFPAKEFVYIGSKFLFICGMYRGYLGISICELLFFGQ